MVPVPVAASVSPRSSIVALNGCRAWWTVACPAEFAPPMTYTCRPAGACACEAAAPW
jgi:hypothetical protein